MDRIMRNFASSVPYISLYDEKFNILTDFFKWGGRFD